MVFLLSFIVHPSSFTRAQEDEPPPPPKRAGVRITFLPPPLEGTLSLGIFNKAGKLVRTLHREAKTDDFTIGLNGLITFWDGKDDAGVAVPAGRYFARGFAVGAIEFEGEAFHFNDWIDNDDTPRIRRIHSISPFVGFPSSPSAAITVTLADGRMGSIPISRDGRTYAFQPSDPGGVSPKKGDAGTTEGDVRIMCSVGEQKYGIRAGKLVAHDSGVWKPVAVTPIENAIDCIAMSEGTGVGWWIIDRVANGSEIKRFASDGTFVRSLTIPANQPQPFGLSIGPDDSLLIILEENPGSQRVRILKRQSLPEPNEPASDAAVSEWSVVMEKTIRVSDEFDAVKEELKTASGTPFVAAEKISVRLLPNQLLRNASTTVDITVGLDAKGSFLRTVDGLVLKRITETPGLRWVAMMRDPSSKGVTVFQSDGAVVEEFKAHKLANMMAFDAGDYDWAGK